MEKVKKKNGISLIVLVITILVMIILAGVVIVTMSENNPIKKAREAQFKESLMAIGEELNMFLVNKATENASFKKSSLYADKSKCEYNTNVGDKNIYAVLPTLKSSKYKNQIEINAGELYYKTPDANEIPWLKDMGIHYVGKVTGTVIIEGDTLVGVSEDYVNTGTLVIPTTVKKIAPGAFANCQDIVSVVLPDGITEVPENCFRNCTALESVTIPNSVKTIKMNAFYSCVKLDNVTMPANLTSIEKGAFYWCAKLSKLVCNSSLTSIGEEAFSYCGITEVSLNNSLVTIGKKAFEGLKAENVVIPDSVTSIGEDAFFSAKVKSMHIGKKAKLDSGALRKTYQLATLTVDAENIHHSAENCALYDKAKTVLYAVPYALADYVMPNTVTTIAKSAFVGADVLKNVTLSNALVTIGERAFEDCINLTSMTVPTTVTSIGIRAFEGCTSLAGLTIASGNTSYKIINGVVCTYDGTTVVSCPDTVTNVTLPDTVTTILDSAFAKTTKLNTITIPKTVTKMEKEVFRSSGLTTCSIPGSVEVVHWGVFKECPNLASVTFNSGTKILNGCMFMYSPMVTSITIPDTVNIIAGDFLTAATGIQNITVSANNKHFSTANNMILSHDKTVLVSGGSTAAVVEIPETVTRIANYAFTTCNEITEVRGGKNVQSIGKYAFLSCRNLKKVFLSNSITQIDNLAFLDTPLLSEIYIPLSKDSVAGSPWSASQGTKAVIWQ